MLLIFGQFDNVAFCVYKFYSGTWLTTVIIEFEPPSLDQQLKLVLNV